MGRWVNQFMNSSERGEWAEIRFVGRAAEQRFRVSNHGEIRRRMT
jgi:hypothetical protein